MGLASIWDNEGNYLKRTSKGFRAKTTGCDCCSATYETKEEKEMVKQATIDSLTYIIRAQNYFGWSLTKLLKEARKKVRQENNPSKT